MSWVDWVALGTLLAIVAGLAVLLAVHLWRWRKLTPDQRDWAQGRVPVSILESLVRTDGPARPATEDATARTTPGEGDGTGAAAQTLSGGPEWMPIDGPSLARCVCGIAHGVPRLDAAARQAVVDQFKTALLTGLDDLQRDPHRQISPGAVADLVHRVALEVGR